MGSLESDRDTATAAVRLAVAVNRFRARLREEAGLTSTGLSSSQVGLLHRLFDEGPTTAASLAAAEHVSQQAIAQSLIGMRDAGYVAEAEFPMLARGRTRGLISFWRAVALARAATLAISGLPGPDLSLCQPFRPVNRRSRPCPHE